MKVTTVNKTIAVSGGFAPSLVWHVRMIQEAAEYGDVVVILNTDQWLIDKKGYVFMPWQERAEIISAIKGVTRIIDTGADTDGSVCNTLRHLDDQVSLDFFANGGDRYETNTPEMDVCKELNIKMLWNVGGGKIQSSSDLVDKSRYWKRRVKEIEV